MVSCNSNSNNKYHDNFYNSKGGFDYYRLPIQKPYDLIATDRDPEYWSRVLENQEIPGEASIAGQKIFVSNNFFVVACKQQNINGIEYPEVYFLIVPGKKTGRTFTSFGSLSKYAESTFAIKKIVFLDIKSVYDHFKRTGELPWLLPEWQKII